MLMVNYDYYKNHILKQTILECCILVNFILEKHNVYSCFMLQLWVAVVALVPNTAQWVGVENLTVLTNRLSYKNG